MSNRVVAGDTEEARRMLEEAADFLRRVDGAGPCGALVRLSVAAEAGAVLGMSDLCRDLYPQLVRMAELVPMRPFDWALTHRVAGMAASCAGDWEKAEQHFAVALAQVRELPNRLDEPQVAHRYAEAILRHRPREDARAMGLLREAVEGYRRLGMPLLLAEAEELLRG